MRFEASYVQALRATSGAAFGAQGSNASQLRGLVELGVLF